MGTNALAPIIRSGAGAFGSTCFWKFAGSAESGTGQDGASGAWASLISAAPSALDLGERIQLGAPGELPGELADPLVEEEASRQPGDGRRPAQAQGGELGRHPWVRSEERRVGKERRSQGAPEREKREKR